MIGRAGGILIRIGGRKPPIPNNATYAASKAFANNTFVLNRCAER